MAAEFRRDTARGVFWIGFALGIFPEDASSRLNLTTTTPYHATGLSQCESITGRQGVAESTTMLTGIDPVRLSVRPEPVQSRFAETPRPPFNMPATSLEPV